MWLQCRTRENCMSTTITITIFLFVFFRFTYSFIGKLNWSRFESREHSHLEVNHKSYHVFWRQVPWWGYSKLKYLVELAYCLRTFFKERGLPLHSHISSFFLCHVYKPARVTWVGGWPYLRARVTQAGRLTFPTPGRVTRLPGLTILLFPDPLSVTTH